MAASYIEDVESERKRFHAVKSESPSNDQVLPGLRIPLPGRWSALPSAALSNVFGYLGNQEVISAGQTCRIWRVVAKRPPAWSRRVLSHDFPGKRDWHAGARDFVRTLRFAPCLARVSCAKSLKGGARAAISNTKCEIRSADLNGQLEWVLKFLCRHKGTLQDLTLLNPKLEALNAALELPNLVSLSVSYEWNRILAKYARKGSEPRFKVPVVPKGTTGKLRKLICHSGVGPGAAESLVLANAATVEEVGVHSLPVAALQQCAKLRRLMVKVDPAKEADRDRLRQLLDKRAAPLDYLAFLGPPQHVKEKHARGPCAELRASLRDRVSGCVACYSCNGESSSVLKRLRFTRTNEHKRPNERKGFKRKNKRGAAKK